MLFLGDIFRTQSFLALSVRRMKLSYSMQSEHLHYTVFGIMIDTSSVTRSEMKDILSMCRMLVAFTIVFFFTRNDPV
jgi:hypothetical protein